MCQNNPFIIQNPLQKVPYEKIESFTMVCMVFAWYFLLVSCLTKQTMAFSHFIVSFLHKKVLLHFKINHAMNVLWCLHGISRDDHSA